MTLTDESINKTNYTGNDEGTERIAPVFTAACTATEILVLKSNGFLEILENTFFLHESFSYLRVDEYDWNVRKGTDIIDRYKGHSREGIMKYKRRGRDHQMIAASLSFCVYVRGEVCVLLRGP